jgi:hypothetical protein
MTDPKQTIYEKLIGITTANVYQNQPEEFEDLDTKPSITFEVFNNVPVHTLDKDIPKQDIRIKIDIWGKTSGITGDILNQVVTEMLELDYTCTFNQDLKDPTGISHLTTQFTY